MLIFFYKTFPKKGFNMEKSFNIEGYELDRDQIKLLINDCNSFVIAGAGSGKTLTILGKISYLIEKKNINPENILVISFTNASVNDIKRRINYNINVFTFHKLAINILNKNQVSYSICNNDLLKYTIKEYLITCTKNEQQKILKFINFYNSYDMFLKSQHFKKFCSIIETFINLYKANNYNTNDILSINYTELQKHILTIIFKIYKKYLEEKNSMKKLDLDDLIKYSTQYVSNKKLNFKYIIIDEFQDTSLIRLNLVKQLYLSEKSKIIVVGDDWQSIYRFSGCDLTLFLNFSKFFPNVFEIKLSNTYRNSQELINIASKFIQKNPTQIKKQLLSKKHNLTPIILAPYKNKSKKLKDILNHLLSISNDILILSRNNEDILQYIDNDIIIINEKILYKSILIPFLTIHKSKGLEAKYTIILNCNNEHLGFPCQIENCSIINKTFEKEKFTYSEERRLFYVALTRCKEQVFILYDKKSPSLFIKELKKIIKTEVKKITYFK